MNRYRLRAVPMTVTQFSLKQVSICALWFKAAWLICVFFGNTGALLVWPATLALYLKFVRIDVRQWKFAAIMVVTGFITDSLLAMTGVLEFASGLPIPPFWLTTLWLLLGILIVVALGSIVRRLSIFSPLCAISGMLSYHAGTSWSDANFGIPKLSALIALAATWAILGIIINRIYCRLLLAEDASPAHQ